MSVQPISPSKVHHKIPDAIIEAVNKLIQQKWSGKSAVIKQEEILAIVSSEDPNDARPSVQTIFDRHYLDFEPLYRDAGWNVEYHKPDYTESFKPYFVFTKKTKMIFS